MNLHHIKRYEKYAELCERLSQDIKSVTARLRQDPHFKPSETLQITIAKKCSIIEEAERMAVNELTALLAVPVSEQTPQHEDYVDQLFKLQRRISDAYGPVMSADTEVLQRIFDLDGVSTSSDSPDSSPDEILSDKPGHSAE